MHCHVGGTTSLLLAAQGDDVECSHINVAVHLFRHFGVQFETEIFLVLLQYIQSLDFPDIGCIYYS